MWAQRLGALPQQCSGTLVTIYAEATAHRAW